MDKNMIEVKFIKTHEKAQLPKRNHNSVSSINVTGDSGYDLFAVEDIVIPATKVLDKVADGAIAMEAEDFECSNKVTIGSAIVPIGLQVAYIQEGHWFRIEARSGMGFRHGIQPHFGIIDNMYTGNLDCKLYNLTGVPYQVKAGDRIAQIVFYPIIEAKCIFTDQINKSARADKGIGSSGK